MKIKFHYTYILIAFGFIITGYFSNLIIFTSIILIHEMGHYIVARINNLNPEEITIYPFGGITKINSLINTPIKKELMVAIAGVIFQTIYYLLIIIFHNSYLIRDYIFDLFTNYHYHILIFNLLPIHPLDGSKILNLLLSKLFPYKITHKITIIISLMTLILLIIINYFCFNYTTILIISIVIDNLIKYYKNINYLFNKFLLERYLYKFNLYKPKKVNKITDMYKEKYHIIKDNNQYFTEKELLNRRFKGKL